MLVYTCFHVFSPFSAHFYPPLHHNGKGSIVFGFLFPRHIVLVLHHGGSYGALGLSRREDLMYKPLVFKVGSGFAVQKLVQQYGMTICTPSYTYTHTHTHTQTYTCVHAHTTHTMQSLLDLIQDFIRSYQQCESV